MCGRGGANPPTVSCVCRVPSLNREQERPQQWGRFYYLGDGALDVFRLTAD